MFFVIAWLQIQSQQKGISYVATLNKWQNKQKLYDKLDCICRNIYLQTTAVHSSHVFRIWFISPNKPMLFCFKTTNYHKQIAAGACKASLDRNTAK